MGSKNAPHQRKDHLMFCSQCGTQVEDGTKFCPTCGSSMQPAEPTPAANATSSAPVQQTVITMQQPGFQPVPGTKPVNRTVYALLAIFLGGLGAHKFYAGKIGLGFVYLLFCFTFIPAIVALIEGIVALGKPVDANGNIWI